MSWLPIESAPKDGTYIQLGNENCVWVGCYIDRYVSGFEPPDKWHSRMLNHDHVAREHRNKPPTHWQPLPEPPTDDRWTLTEAGRAMRGGK